MEEEHVVLDDHDHDHDDNGRSGSGVGGSRWNPTKEQIGLLERMYSEEGVRTPSAEQIQQITARLRAYGPIEGKNVFYWFQNHKARQRQKLRQDRLAAAASSTHRFLPPPHLHHLPNPNNFNPNLIPRPIFPPPNYHYHHQYLPSPNVICSSYYQHPQTNLGFYPPHPPQHHYSAPAADFPGTRRSKAGTTALEMPRGGGVPPGSTLSGYCAAMMKTTPVDHDHDGHKQKQESHCMRMRTLNLFPVHPTGILEHKLGNGSSTNNSAECSSATNTSDDTHTDHDNGSYDHHQRIIDFFCSGHVSSESD